MADEKRDALTADEVAALKYCAERGRALPDWLTQEGEKYFRPHRFTPEQFADYAARLQLYDQHVTAEGMAKVKTWLTILGILAIVDLVIALLF